MPQFTTAANAFCTCFSTLVILCFAALHMVGVAGAPGFQLAAVFLPMTVLVILSSVLAGRVLAGLGMTCRR